MPLINQSVEKAVASVPLGGPVMSDLIKTIREALLKEFGDDVWRWYRSHENDVIFTIRQKVFFFTANVDVRVKHARAIFERIAGPEPGAQTQPTGFR